MVDILRQQILYKANQMLTSSEEIKRNEDKEKGDSPHFSAKDI